MANEEHLSLLLEGRRPWNEWREANPALRPDLRKADLHEADLSEMNLKRVLLNEADLRGACLKGSNLAGANLRRADLREADFRRSDLHGATLAKTDLRDANLREADIREADMRDAKLAGADFAGADLKGAVLHKDGFRYVSLHNDQPHTAPANPAPNNPAPADAAASSRAGPAAASRKSAPDAPATTTRRIPLKLALGGGGTLLAVGMVGMWVSRPAPPADARVSEAVSQAIGTSSGVDSVEVQGDALVLRSGRATVESSMYLSLLKSACQALEEIEPASGLREIRITNQSGEEGWIYGAPEECGEILTKPEALTGLSIAAHTTPIRKR